MCVRLCVGACVRVSTCNGVRMFKSVSVAR